MTFKSFFWLAFEPNLFIYMSSFPFFIMYILSGPDTSPSFSLGDTSLFYNLLATSSCSVLDHVQRKNIEDLTMDK